MGLKVDMDQPEVSVLLSGMNSMEQVIENIPKSLRMLQRTLSPKEKDVIEQVKNIFRQRIKVNCTCAAIVCPVRRV